MVGQTTNTATGTAQLDSPVAAAATAVDAASHAVPAISVIAIPDVVVIGVLAKHVVEHDAILIRAAIVGR
jgi:hypothetical protein